MRSELKTREEVGQWFVHVWQDAIAFKYKWPTLMNAFKRVRESQDYKHLNYCDRAYAEGFQRCYELYVVQRSWTESGDWVRMPDGTELYFGVRERLQASTPELEALYASLKDYGIHRYIYENRIPGRSGIYWASKGPNGEAIWDGKHPMFIPEPDISNPE